MKYFSVFVGVNFKRSSRKSKLMKILTFLLFFITDYRISTYVRICLSMGKGLCLRVVNGLGLRDEIHDKLKSLAAYTKNGRVIAFSSWKNVDSISSKVYSMMPYCT